MAADDAVIIIRADASQAVSELTALRNAVSTAYGQLDKAAESFKELSQNQKNLNNISKITKKLQNDLGAAYKKHGRNSKKASAAVRQNVLGLKALNTAFATGSMRAHRFARDIRGVGLAVRNSGKNLQFMGRSIMIGMLPFANAIRNASNYAKALEQAEIRLAKVADLSANELAPIADQMLEISTNFGVSRDLITDIAADFAQVGFPTSELGNLVTAANELSLLGNIDAGPAKDIFISTVFAMQNMAELNGEVLGFEDAVKQATGQMYLFNMVENNTALAIDDLAESIPKLVPISAQFGLSITEAAGALAALKASGITAAEGTTALRTGLLRLTTLTKQADEKVNQARATLAQFDFQAGVGIETLASFGDSITAVRTELGDAAAFDIVKNILGIRQTAKVNLFVTDMQRAKREVSDTVAKINELAGTEIINPAQITSITDFSKIAREPSAAMMQAAADMISSTDGLDDVTSQFLRSLIVQMTGVENAANMSIEEMQKVVESDAFKMQQAKNNMKNAMTEMGTTINDMLVTHILPLVNKVVDAFNNMSEPMKRVIIIVGAVAAAFGPLLYALAILKMASGQVMQVFGGVFTKIFGLMTKSNTEAMAAANSHATATRVVSNAKKEELFATTSLTKANFQLAASREADRVAMGFPGKDPNKAVHGMGTARVGKGIFGKGKKASKASRVAKIWGRNRQILGPRAALAEFQTAKKGGHATRNALGQIQARGISGKAGLRVAAVQKAGVGGIAKGVKAAPKNMLKAATSTKSWGKGLTKVAGLFGKIGKFAKMLLNPIKMIRTIFTLINPVALAFALAIGVAAAVFAVIKNDFENFKNAVQPGLTALQEAFGLVKTAVMGLFKPFIDLFNRFNFGAKKGASQGAAMGGIVSAALKGVSFVLKGVAKLFEFLALVIKTALDFVTPYLNFFLGLMSAFKEIIKVIIALVKGDFGAAWKHAKRAVGAVLLAMVSMVDGIFNFMVDKIAWFMDRAADAVGWMPFVDWGDDIRDAADAVRSFASTALDGVRGAIADATGIQADELFGFDSDAVHDIGGAVGDSFTGGVNEAVDLGLETADPGIYDATNGARAAGEEAGKAFANAFKKFSGKVKANLETIIQNMLDRIRKQFNKQTEAMAAVYDNMVEKIQDVIKAEERLTKELDFQTSKRDMIKNRALQNEQHVRNRALAIYEGRVDDARDLDLEDKKNKEEHQEKLSDLVTGRAKEILKQQRSDLIEQVNFEKGKMIERREILENLLFTWLGAITEFTPENEAEWQEMMDGIELILTSTLTKENVTGWFETFGSTIGGTLVVDDILEGIAEFPDNVGGFLSTALTSEDVTGWFDKFSAAIGGDVDANEILVGLEEFPGDVLGMFISEPGSVMEMLRDEFNPYDVFKSAFDEANNQLMSEYKWTVELGFLDWMIPYMNPIFEHFETLIASAKSSLGGVGDEVGGLNDDLIALAGAVELVTQLGDYTMSSYDFEGMGLPGIGSLARGGDAADLLNFEDWKVIPDWVIAGISEAEHLGYSHSYDTNLGRDLISKNEADVLSAESITPMWQRDWGERRENLVSSFEQSTDTIIPDVTSIVTDAVGNSVIQYEGVMYNPEGESPIEAAIAGKNPEAGRSGRPTTIGNFGGDYFYFGGAVKAQYGKYLGGFGSSMIPVMAHGGEFVMSAKATQQIGVGALSNMNNYGKYGGPTDAGGGGASTSSSNVTINVDTFVGQREWFESMMSDYNIHIAPGAERVRGVENRTVGSYVDQNKRSRV